MIENIIDKYQCNLRSLCSNKNKNPKLELVLNSDWDKINDDLKIIYCGDNPGKKEKENNSYFVGYAGKELKLFVETHNKKHKINSGEFTFFNKTPFYSNKTSKLTRNDDENKLIEESIKLTINCLYDIWKIKKIQIVVFGINERSYIVKIFKETLKSKKKYSKFFKELTILNHPSHNSLFAEIGKYLINEFDDKEEIKNIKYSDLINEVKKKW